MTKYTVCVDTTLHSSGLIQKQMKPAVKLRNSNEYIDRHYAIHLYRIFTDGSKKESLVGSGFYVNSNYIKRVFIKRLENHFSNNVAEMQAISDSLLFVASDESIRTDTVLILTDSLPMCEYLKTNPIDDTKKKQDTLVFLKDRVYQLCVSLKERGIHVTITWIPAHCAIEGNTVADWAADKGRLLDQIGELQELPLPLMRDSKTSG